MNHPRARLPVGGSAVRLLVGSLVAAWLLPTLTHLLGLDLLLVPVIVLVTASLLRVGGTFVGRLLVASVVLWCALAPAGLLFSVWPWGLAPVPIAGLALSLLVLVAALTGRRPQWRTPFTGTDAMVAGSATVAAVVAGLPLLRTDATGRLALVFQGEDLSRHFAIFDLQTRLGGYLFLRPDADSLLAPGLVSYPQGSHLAAAVLDRFLRGGVPGSPEAAFDGYLLWTVVTYVLFVACLVWATARIGGDLVRGWWAAPVLTVVAASAIFGPLFTLLLRGYPSELAGLALFATGVALLCRARPTREYLVVLATIAVGVAYNYYFLVPVLGVAAGWWLLEHRRELPWRWLLPLGAVAVGLAVVPLLANRAASVGETLALGGPVVAVDRIWLLILLAPPVMAVLAGRLWREPGWRLLGVTGVAAAGFAAALTVFQVLAAGQGYYVEKALHIVLVVGLLALGALGTLLAPLVSGRTVTAAVAVVGVLAVLAGFRAIDPGVTRVPAYHHIPAPHHQESWGRAHLEGQLSMRYEAAAVRAAVAQEQQGTDARMIVFWGAFNRGTDFYATQYAAALQRRFTGPAYDAMLFIPRPRSEQRLVDFLTLVGDTPVTLHTR
ncbi:MAG: hypothetical protein ACRDT4_19415, partial [Micromonosporaceae bacterium]